MSNQLVTYRAEIDAIDEQLRTLLVQRFALSAKIGAYKREHGLPVFDAAREREIAERLGKIFSTREEKEAMQTIWQTIMRESKRVQIAKNDVR